MTSRLLSRRFRWNKLESSITFKEEVRDNFQEIAWVNPKAQVPHINVINSIQSYKVFVNYFVWIFIAPINCRFKNDEHRIFFSHILFNTWRAEGPKKVQTFADAYQMNPPVTYISNYKWYKALFCGCLFCIYWVSQILLYNHSNEILTNTTLVNV